MKPDLAIKNKIHNLTYIRIQHGKFFLIVSPTTEFFKQTCTKCMFTRKKYITENITLIYPFTEKIPSDKVIEFHLQDDVVVRTKFVDLFDRKNSLSVLVNEL